MKFNEIEAGELIKRLQGIYRYTSDTEHITQETING